jgi:hypothetical protein
MSDLTFSCPVCGADVPRKALSCPECGACEKSGWSEDRYLDGLNLPGEELPPRPSGLPRVWWWAAVIVLAAFLLLMLRGMW